jgi:hypothetical protein
MTRLSVSVIGSFRKNYAQILFAAKEFEKAGVTVNSPSISRIINPGEPFVRFETDPPHSSDHVIQNATFERIFASDFIYVVAPAGYIGRTTCYELGRIQERGISVFFSEPVQDLPIEISADSVLQPYALAQRMLRIYGVRRT